MNDLKISIYGDAAVCVEFAQSFTDEAWMLAHELALQIKSQKEKWLLSVIPTYTSVLIYFDLYIIDAHKVTSYIENLIPTLNPIPSPSTRQRFQVPVVYGGEFGPELPVIAKQLNLSQEEVISLHHRNPSRVICFTSPAGQPLLDQSLLPDKITRLSMPRVQIPIGSVAVVGNQTTVYAQEGPGGWRIIGRTPIQITRPEDMPPAPFKPGDMIEFIRITEQEWSSYEGKTIYDMQVINK